MVADIMVTTPKPAVQTAAKEAAEVKAAGGGEYFRVFSFTPKGLVLNESRVYYVERDYIRGFCLVNRVVLEPAGRTCDTTGRYWAAGSYVFMDATTWKWILPVAHAGFQSWRYCSIPRTLIQVVGGWLDPMPSAYGDDTIKKGQILI